MNFTAAAETLPDDSLTRAQAGDSEAFAELVAAHEAMVFSLAFHFFGQRERAADVAQEVFLQLFRALDTIESQGHLLFWLRQVTSRKCIDELRRKRLRSVSLDDIAEPATPAPDPLLGRELRKLIARLPESQRIVVTLRYQEDLGPEEISHITNIPLNTVKSHLHRALRSLRRSLEES